MATDTTTNQTETANNTSTIHESDVEQVHLTQSGTPVQVQVPQGENVVRVQVTPGETIQLPFPTDGLVARLGDNGNLAVKVGDVTVILLGYAEATGQAEVTILGSDNQPLDVAAVLASTDPNLDIQTAAGPGAGDAGTGVDNNGGVFSPFDPNAGIGGLNAIGGLDPTALNYNLIQREFVIFEEGDEVDTSPIFIGVTGDRVVNEDDLGRAQEVELEEAIQAARALQGFDSDEKLTQGEVDIVGRLSALKIEGFNGECASFGKHEDGNDPFDTGDHEEGSQTDAGKGAPDDGVGQNEDDNGGLDQDREPLSVTAKVEVNFQGNLPGKLTFDADGDGIDTGDTPIITQLQGMNLTSHDHALQYMLLPAVAESAPGAGDGRGQMVIAFYLEQACRCGGEGENLVPVIVFSVSIDDDAVNGDEPLSTGGNSEIPVTFTIYGVIDNGVMGSGKDGEDILNIDTPFYISNPGNPPELIDGGELVFQDVDDVPQLGGVDYDCENIPEAIVEVDLTIGHDESALWQHTDYEDSDGNTQYTDDSIQLPWDAKEIVQDAFNDNAGGNTGVNTVNEDVKALINPGKFDNGFLGFGFKGYLGSASVDLNVSFGADGKAIGNEKNGIQGHAGATIFSGDAPTDKAHAFELYMQGANATGGPGGGVAANDSILGSATNVTVLENGQTLTVRAYQVDAYTIIGIADPNDTDGDGQNDEGGALGATGIPVFVIHIDPQSGELTFTQYHQVQHADGSDANDPLSIKGTTEVPGEGEEGAETVEFDLLHFRATDFDGDYVDAKLDVAIVDDAPCILGVKYLSDGKLSTSHGSVDEDHLTAATNGVPGHKDSDTSPDNLNNPIGDGNNGDGPGKTKVTGLILADIGVDKPGVFSFALDFTGGPIATDYKTAGGLPVTLILVGDTLKGVAGDPAADVFTLKLNASTGAFEFNLVQALFHKDNDGTATKDGDTADDATNRYEDDISLTFPVKLTDSDGDTSSATLNFKVDDDAPKLICLPETTSIQNGECPVCQTEVTQGINAVVDQSNDCLTEETCMVTIAPGEPYPNWLKLSVLVLDENGVDEPNPNDDDLFAQNGLGFGVVSGEDGGSGGRFDEINYDHTANNGEGASETLIFKIGTEECPQYALSGTAELSRFFSSEGNVGNEQGHWEAWKDGVKVGEGDFTASNLSGQFGLAIPSIPGGFNELRFTAKAGTLTPGGGFSDDSDYFVQSLNLEIQPVHVLTGQFKYSLGADGGDANAVVVEYKGAALTSGGEPVVMTKTVGPDGIITISGFKDVGPDGHDAGDLPLFKMVIDPSASDSNGVHTATYTFSQYGPLDNNPGGSTLPFQVTIQDRDHDAITTSIDICINDSAPEADTACATVYEKSLNQAGDSKDGTDENSDGEFAHGFLNFSYNGDGPGSITEFKFGAITAVGVGGLWVIDQPQFKITVDKITGEYHFELKQNLNHDNTADDGFDNREGVEGTVNVADILQSLGFTYTVADADGSTANGGLTVKVVDDGPILCVDLDSDGEVRIDETPGNQNNDERDDQTDANLPPAFAAVAGFPGSIIEWARDGDAVIDVDVEFGADGKAAVNGLVISVEIPAPGTDSGIDFVDQDGIHQNVVLTKEGDLVVGRVGAGDDAGKLVFAVGIDSTGHLQVAQYAPIQHDNTGNHDDVTDLINSALIVKVVATDGDGDQAVKTVNVGDMVKFYDDGPSIDHSSSVTLDEDVIPGAGGNHPGGTGDVNPSLFSANGDLNISFGTDGPGAIEISLNGAPPRLTGDGAFLTFTQIGNTLIGHTGNPADPALTVQVNNDGTYTVTLLKPLDHPNGNNENDIDLQFKVKVTDNDGDSDTGTINVKIDDDAPTQIGVSDYTDQNTAEPANGDNHHGGEYGYLDEDFLPAGNKDLDANDTDDAIGGVKSIALLSGVSVGADGGSLTINAGTVVVHGDDGSGLRRSSDGALITMVTSPDGQTITGYANNVQDLAHTVFTIKVVGNTVEFELFQALMQDDTDKNYNSGDGNIEGEIKFDIPVTLTDKDNDSTSTTVRFLVDDDKPTVDVSAGSDTNVILTTQDAETIGAAFDTAVSAANFGGVFSFLKSGGADGEQSSSLTFALNVTNGSSGLQIGGVNINLFKIGNDIVGSTAGSAGSVTGPNTVFKISVDGTGVVTLTQYQQIDHGTPESSPSYDDDIRTLANGKVSLTANGSITDKDNDSASDSASIDLGGNIKFADDGPNAVNEVSALAIGSINTTTIGTNLLLNDTVGADTPGTLTQVIFTNGAQNVAGGGGSDFFVDGAGNRLAGAAGSIGILHIEQDGDWSFKQTGFTGSDLTFSYKLVDKDGDSDTASFTVDTQNVPPPSFTFASANVDEDGLPNGNFDDINPALPNDTQPGDDVTGAGPSDTSEKTFEGTFGLGAQSITSMSLAATTLADLANFKNLSGVSVNNITLSNGNMTLVASAGGIDLVKVEITDATTGAFKVTLLNPIQHSNSASEDNVSANVQVTATNAGGSQTNGIVINVDDDRPTVSLSTQGAPTLTVDETAPGYGTPTNQSVLGLFGAHTFGADGAAAGGGVSYSLTGAGGLAVVDGTPSGLTDLNGTSINLYNEGGAIVGRVGPAGGIIAFQVSISGSTVSLTQVWPIKHPNIADPDDALSATANLIYVTKTVTDADGDVAKATSSSALTLTFKDDGPDAADDGGTVATLGVAINGNVANNDTEGTDFIVGGGHPNGQVVTFTIDAIDYAANGAVHNIPGHGTMSMTSTGAYVFTQTEGAGGVLNVTYKLVDGDGDSDTATLAITTVADAAPVNYNDKDSGNENVKQDTNVMIILDVSGSMGWDIDPNTPDTQDRLTLAKAALAQLLNAYDALGDVAVTIVTFDSNSSVQYAWGSVGGAITEINTFNPGSNTNYANALNQADDAWIAPGKIVGAQNVVYFLSDGEPNEGSPNYPVWDTFLETNGIDKIYSVAVGDGISGNEGNPDGDLLSVADPDGNDSPDGQVIYVTNANELAAELVGTINNQPIVGNVLNGSHTSGNGDTGVAGVTPDAAGNGTTYIHTFVYNSANNAFDAEFSWNGVDANVTLVGEGANADSVITGHSITFKTEYGEMTFNFDNGAYSFAAGSVPADTNVVFHYGTKDADGDTDLADIAGGGADDDSVPGNSIAGGADLVITIHNIVAVPAITSIDDNVGSIQGVVPDNGVTDDTVLVLHGTSEAGSLVKVYDGLTYLGDAISDGLGNWTFTTAALANGTDHHFNATATLGNTSAPSGNYDVTIDTTAPTVAVNIVDASQNDNNTSSNVTFIFSEVPVGFSAVDVSAVGGTVTGLTQDLGSDPSGKTWTATFNANDGFDGNATVSVTNGSYTDAAGNLGNFNFDSVPVDRVNPTVTVNIVDAALSDADTSSVVTFVFSEVPTNFTAVDISASNGIVSGLTQDLILDPSGKTYTATFTKTAGVNGVGSVTVANNSYTDAATNNGSGGSDTVTITSVVNEAPVGGFDRIITQRTDTVTVLSAWMMNNDSDTDNPSSDLFISNVSGNNDWTLNKGGLGDTPSSFTFNIDEGEMGDGSGDNFSYVLKDGDGGETTVNANLRRDEDDNDSFIGDDGTDDATDDIVIGSASGGETLSGRDGNDVLVGGGGDDIYLGDDGTDTVVFRASVTTIVSGGGGNFQDGDFEGIEVIDLGVGHDAVVLGAATAGNRLNADDVLNITDNAGTALFIKGDAGDSLFLDNSGGDALTVSGTQDQAGFTHYTGTSGGNTVHLYVDTDIVVNAGA